MSADEKPGKAAPESGNGGTGDAAAEQPAAAGSEGMAPPQPDLSDEVKEQFKKLEVVLRETAEKFRVQGIHPRVYAASMLEVGILALIHVGADDAKIREVVETLIARNRALRQG